MQLKIRSTNSPLVKVQLLNHYWLKYSYNLWGEVWTEHLLTCFHTVTFTWGQLETRWQAGGLSWRSGSMCKIQSMVRIFHNTESLAEWSPVKSSLNNFSLWLENTTRGPNLQFWFLSRTISLSKTGFYARLGTWILWSFKGISSIFRV